MTHQIPNFIKCCRGRARADHPIECGAGWRYTRSQNVPSLNRLSTPSFFSGSGKKVPKRGRFDKLSVHVRASPFPT